MISNVIKTYDDMLYDSRPVSFSEFISNKYNNVHNELYNDALEKFYLDIVNNTISIKFIYEFYSLMTNNSESFNDFYNAFKNLNDKSELKKSLQLLGINSKEFLSSIFELTNSTLDKVKSYIHKCDIIKGVTNISNIGDFRVVYTDTFYVNTVTFLEAEENNDSFEQYGQEFISYVIRNNTAIEEKIFSNELFDYVFILEEEHGTKIGYNKDGEWILIIGENYKFKTVNDICLERNISVTPEIYNDIEYKLYSIKNDILEHLKDSSINLISKYKDIALKQYKKHHKIIEIKNSEYWQPSSIVIISNVRPYRKTTVDLSKYWNMIQSNNDISVYDIKNTNENMQDSELYEINYITGTAKIYSRSNDLKFEVPFKYLDGDINVNDNITINNTFKSKYNELYL